MNYFKQILMQGNKTYAFSDDAPEWVKDAVHKAHQGSWSHGLQELLDAGQINLSEGLAEETFLAEREVSMRKMRQPSQTPNDWVFNVCRLTFSHAYNQSFGEDELDYLANEFADNEVSTRTNALAQWYADNCECDFVVDAEDELSEIGLESDSMTEALKQLQRMVIKNIAHIVLKAIFDNQVQQQCVNG